MKPNWDDIEPGTMKLSTDKLLDYVDKLGGRVRELESALVEIRNHLGDCSAEQCGDLAYLPTMEIINRVCDEQTTK